MTQVILKEAVNEKAGISFKLYEEDGQMKLYLFNHEKAACAIYSITQ